jgi:hypothetical protein
MHDRLRTREITEDDIVKLMNWISTNPEVPDDAWCKDFGAFKLVGHGESPGTLLTRNQTVLRYENIEVAPSRQVSITS